jgi:hypothetical protein
VIEVTSRKTDLQDRAVREANLDRALAEDRRGRDRLIRQADMQMPDRSQLSATPNTGGNR